MAISSVSAQNILEKKFGPVDIKIISQTKSKRVSIRTTKNGMVIAYNIVHFSGNLKKYSKIHKLIIAGNSIGEVIQKAGHKILRLENCSFHFNLPRLLKNMFKTTKKISSVKSVVIYIDEIKEQNKYASVIEIYSPICGIEDSFEIEKGLIQKTEMILKKISSF